MVQKSNTATLITGQEEHCAEKLHDYQRKDRRKSEQV